ncbi:hypothetical protein AB4Y63_04915, partial [Leifsonia sp. YAF41]|uniref:hypothetical protein n=1 Tax=Leifsonia sp. YAF41 TaxID=3233086 RepID=UPI003F9D95D6
MDQLELLHDEVEDFGVFTDLDPLECHFGMSPAEFPGFVDALLPDDPGEGERRESGYTARLNEYLDVVVAEEKQLAVHSARRARAVDEARR